MARLLLALTVQVRSEWVVKRPAVVPAALVVLEGAWLG